MVQSLDKTLGFWTSKKINTTISVIMFIICTSLLMFLSQKAVENLLRREIGTANVIQSMDSDLFPEMTFCASDGYKPDQVQGVEKVKYLRGQPWGIDLKDNSTSPAELFEQTTYTLDEIVENIQIWIDKSLGGLEEISLNGSIIDHCSLIPVWKTKPYHYFGKCYSLSLPACLTDRGILEVSVGLKIAADVFFGYSGQFLSPNSRFRVNFPLRINSDVETEIRKISPIVQIHEELVGYGTCQANFDYDECILGALYDEQMRLLNCTVIWLKNQDHVCRDQEDMAKAIDHYHKNRRNQNKVCPEPCQTANVIIGSPVTEIDLERKQAKYRNITSLLKVYFQRDVAVVKEYLLTTPMKTLAEVGGYAGLLLGFSFVLYRIMYCLQWLIPVLLIPKPMNPTLLHNHAMFMILYIAGFFLERKPCTVCSFVFGLAIFLICMTNCGKNCLVWNCNSYEDSFYYGISNVCNEASSVYQDFFVICDTLRIMKINEKTLIAYATSNSSPIDKEGWLWKRGDVNKNFQKRYFVLRGNLLFYFEKSSDKEPVGVIVLEGSTIELAEEEQEMFAFKIIFHGSGHRTYILGSDSQEVLESWMKCLACSSFDYMKLMVIELQQQLDELDEAEQNSTQLTDAPVAPPRQQRQNPFNNPGANGKKKAKTWKELHQELGILIAKDRQIWLDSSCHKKPALITDL